MSDIINRKDITSFLANTRVFELLDSEHIDALVQKIRVRNLRPEQIVWLQGQQITSFLVVFKGQLRSVRRNISGSEKLVSIFDPGYHFGLAEMVTGASSSVTLVSSTSSTILTIDLNSLQKILLDNSVICYRIMQTMARHIFALTREIERASFENVHTRLARLLLQYKLHYNKKLLTNTTYHHKKPVFDVYNVTHEQLAVELGVNRETVSRVIADFKKKGLIKTAYRSITVLDRDGLMEYVEDYDQW